MRKLATLAFALSASFVSGLALADNPPGPGSSGQTTTVCNASGCWTCTTTATGAVCVKKKQSGPIGG